MASCAESEPTTNEEKDISLTHSSVVCPELDDLVYLLRSMNAIDLCVLRADCLNSERMRPDTLDAPSVCAGDHADSPLVLVLASGKSSRHLAAIEDAVRSHVCKLSCLSHYKSYSSGTGLFVYNLY